MSDQKMTSLCIDYLEGLLTPEEMRIFEQKLTEDPSLAKLFEDYKELFATEKMLKDSAWTTPQGFESRLFTRIATEEQLQSHTLLRRFFEVFKHSSNSTQVRVGLFATVFLLSFSILLMRNAGTDLSPLGIPQKSKELANYAPAQESRENYAASPEALSAASVASSAGAPPAPVHTVSEEESELAGPLEMEKSSSQDILHEEVAIHKRAKRAPQPLQRGIPLEENSFTSKSNDASARVRTRKLDEEFGDAAARNQLPRAQNAPSATTNDKEASNTARGRVVTKNDHNPQPSSLRVDRECPLEHAVVTLGATQRIFELPAKDAKVIYTTSKQVRAIPCNRVGAWISLRYLEGNLCPWAPVVIQGTECPMGWVILQMPPSP